MLILPKLVLPPVLRRALDAYRANDPISVAEAYATDARLITRLDTAVAAQMNLTENTPIVASGGVGILRYYAYDLLTYHVKNLEMVSLQIDGRNIYGVCNWELRLRETGESVLGTCENIWTLDSSGRKFVAAQNICKSFVPVIDKKIN